MTTAFEVGKTYSCRSACDQEAVFAWTVVARSGKMITISNEAGHKSRRGIRERDGVETIHPLGFYSMAPVLFADRPAK